MEQQFNSQSGTEISNGEAKEEQYKIETIVGEKKKKKRKKENVVVRQVDMVPELMTALESNPSEQARFGDKCPCNGDSSPMNPEKRHPTSPQICGQKAWGGGASLAFAIGFGPFAGSRQFMPSLAPPRRSVSLARNQEHFPLREHSLRSILLGSRKALEHVSFFPQNLKR